MDLDDTIVLFRDVCDVDAASSNCVISEATAFLLGTPRGGDGGLAASSLSGSWVFDCVMELLLDMLLVISANDIDEEDILTLPDRDRGVPFPEKDLGLGGLLAVMGFVKRFRTRASSPSAAATDLRRMKPILV